MYKQKMQRHLLLWILLFLTLGLKAQNVKFTTTAPDAVAKGDQFRVVYTLRGGDGENINVPSTIKGFDILYGPAVSSSTSTQIINGNVTTDSSESYIYTLIANSEGTFTIPAATITVKGKSYTSNSVQIRVLPPDKNAQNQKSGEGQASAATSTAQNIKPSDAFIRAIVSKSKVSEQESFVVTFRFYTTLEVRDIGKIEFPEFEGFMVEEQPMSATRQMTFEHYNGRNYYAVDLRRTLLFPQRSGKITIPSGKIEMVFNVRSGKTVQTFFGPQYVMTDVKKTMTTSPLTIDVNPLPEGKPANFSNGVGTFSMTPSISATDIKANDPVTIKLVISGTGNMKLIKTPELVLPKDFESYDPKITNDLNYTDNGLTGTKTIEYLFIPRYQGTFKIPPLSLSYFDIKTRSYKTISTPEYTLNVAKDPHAGNNSATSFTQTDVQVEQDIRYIKTGNPSLASIDSFIFGSLSYWLWYIVPFILFVVFLILYRKQIKENADIARLKTKRANKVAVKRLKLAGKYLQDHKKEPFYEEVLRAVWGYLSDKLIIPIADLSRDNMEQELNKYGASQELITKFISILDTCEFARYAPVESDTAMDDLYKDAVNAIGEMENSKIKK